VNSRERLVDLGFAAGWAAVKALPQPLAAAGFRAFADLATRRDGRGVRQLRANLRRVLGARAGADGVPRRADHGARRAGDEQRRAGEEGPGAGEFDAVVAEAMRSYGRYWMETFRLPKMDPRRVAARVETRTVGAEHIDAAVDAGRGFILALPHSGNWDVAGVWLIERTGRGFATVNERLRPESLYDRFVAFRESLGFEVLPLTGGARPPSEVLAERLRAGGSVCLLADRDLSRGGVAVSFFGEPTRMPAGPALLAATTGAALLPVSLWFTPDGWGQWIGAPVEVDGPGRLRDRVGAATQTLADAFAARIAEHPADWHMLQRLWLADLPPARIAELRPPGEPAPDPRAATAPTLDDLGENAGSLRIPRHHERRQGAVESEARET